MNTQGFLIVNSNGSMSIRKTKPALDWNEVAVRLEINLPDILFQRPQLEARIVVSDKAVNPIKIGPEILINTKDLIEQQTGMKIDLRVLHFDKEDIETNKIDDEIYREAKEKQKDT